MKKQNAIQLAIAQPCHEDWGKMSRQEQGRFCAACQKTVIDFTGWSDGDLYRFFQNYQGSVCGRFFNTQLNKELRIPAQPSSRLYKLAIACGLTLMFAQIPEANARLKPQSELLTAYKKEGGDDKDTRTKATGKLSGLVLDEYGFAIPNAIVELTVRGIKKVQTTADANGRYQLDGLKTGKYELSAKKGKLKASLININISADEETVRDISITLGTEAPEPIMMGGISAEPFIQGDVAPEVVPEPAPPPTMGKPVIKKGKVKARK